MKGRKFVRISTSKERYSCASGKGSMSLSFGCKYWLYSIGTRHGFSKSGDNGEVASYTQEI